VFLFAQVLVLQQTLGCVQMDVSRLRGQQQLTQLRALPRLAVPALKQPGDTAEAKVSQMPV
jgi:hypothetical protein